MIEWRLLLHDALASLLRLERRLEPPFRQRWNHRVRDLASFALQLAIDAQRPREKLGLAEERWSPEEEGFIDQLIALCHHSAEQAPRHQKAWLAREKIHGVVRAELEIRNDLPEPFRRGLFAQPRKYRAWVSFTGLVPQSMADLDGPGFLSMNVKVLGVPGPKLMDDERLSQDFVGHCTPTYATPNARAQVQLWAQALTGTPLFYFLNRREPHFLDLLMQSLWLETQTSPLECTYYSGLPILLGEGQAALHAFRPRLATKSTIRGLPFRVSPDYLSENMARTLGERAVELDLMLQLQKDPHRMPLEDARVLWPEHISPWVRAAVLRIPVQKFDSPAQLAFARSLSFTPWHCIPEHRPLGSLSRALRRLYPELVRERLSTHGAGRYEPTGDELFSGLPALRHVEPARERPPSPRASS